MGTNLIVINAGSSSLKFCVYRPAAGGDWPAEARGQIEAIGTAPRLTVKDAAGATVHDEALGATVRDAGGLNHTLGASPRRHNQ